VVIQKKPSKPPKNFSQAEFKARWLGINRLGIPAWRNGWIIHERPLVTQFGIQQAYRLQSDMYLAIVAAWRYI
jgi:hypothetical protein